MMMFFCVSAVSATPNIYNKCRSYRPHSLKCLYIQDLRTSLLGVAPLVLIRRDLSQTHRPQGSNSHYLIPSINSSLGVKVLRFSKVVLFCETWIYFATTKQFPSNSLPKSVQVPFLAYSMERTYNGLTTDLKRRTSEPEVNEKWKVKNGESGFRKNFFAKTLHPYTSTLCNVHYVSSLYGFQIYANPTPTLHQPYTRTWIFQKFRLIDNL